MLQALPDAVQLTRWQPELHVSSGPRVADGRWPADLVVWEIWQLEVHHRLRTTLGLGFPNSGPTGVHY